MPVLGVSPHTTYPLAVVPRAWCPVLGKNRACFITGGTRTCKHAWAFSLGQQRGAPNALSERHDGGGKEWALQEAR